MTVCFSLCFFGVSLLVSPDAGAVGVSVAVWILMAVVFRNSSQTVKISACWAPPVGRRTYKSTAVRSTPARGALGLGVALWRLRITGGRLCAKKIILNSFDVRAYFCRRLWCSGEGGDRIFVHGRWAVIFVPPLPDRDVECQD